MPEDGFRPYSLLQNPPLLSLLAPALVPRPSMSAPPRATTFTLYPLFVHPHCTTTHSARVCIVGCTYDSALSDLTHYFHAWTSVPAGSSRPTDRPSAHPAVGCSCFTLYIYVVAQALESACVVCVLVLSLFDFPVGIHVGFSRVPMFKMNLFDEIQGPTMKHNRSRDAKSQLLNFVSLTQKLNTRQAEPLRCLSMISAGGRLFDVENRAHATNQEKDPQ